MRGRSNERPRVLFVAAMGGLGGPVKRLSTLLSNLEGVDRVLLKPTSPSLDARLHDLRAIDEHISMRRSAQRNKFGALLIAMAVFVRCLARRRPILVIHANGLVEFALCWPTALLLRKPIVTWIGNYECPTFVKTLCPIFRRGGIRTYWCAVSSFAANVVEDCGLASPGEVKVITNIIDPSDIAPTAESRDTSERRNGITYIGYLQVARWEKGFDLLVPVIHSFSDLKESVCFLIYASPNDHPSWEGLDAIGRPLVELRSRSASVGDVYGQCDIVFSPSRRESFNRVAAESLMSGTPLVASDLDPVREVVGDAALLFPPGNADLAAAQLRRLVEDRRLRSQLRRLGVERSSRWLPGPVATEFASLYAQAASR